MKLTRLLQASNSQGVKSEKQALLFLEQQGLSLIYQNYLCKLGEIDLIMLDGETLVFIEVRFRKNSHFGGGLASITQAKQKKIIRTARHYLSQLDNEPYCRFDAIAIDGVTNSAQWIKDAFQAD